MGPDGPVTTPFSIVTMYNEPSGARLLQQMLMASARQGIGADADRQTPELLSMEE